MFRDVNITHPDFVGTSVVPRTGAQITLTVWRIMVGDQFHKRVVAMYNLLPACEIYIMAARAYLAMLPASADGVSESAL